ncbi:FAD-dependent oxidoreductase [Pseudoalteromonas spongiae]|uniref:FAD-dependent oxidoreductase n=1 Tax=Pseudoalteromonas spongiae TaxID=298657 RepID=UPI003736054D
MTYQPFWFDQAMAEETISVSSASIDENPYDIAIIGGGFTGLWTAITIKQHAPKTRIVILEKDLCGQGASGRNGGAMLTWSTKYLSLKKHFGESQAKWLVQQSENAVHAISQFAEEHNIDCDLRVDGCYISASNAAQQGVLTPCLDALDGVSLNQWQVVKKEQLKHTGSRQNQHAVFSPHAGSVQPATLVRGLRRVAIKMGIVISESTRYVSHVKENAPQNETISVCYSNKSQSIKSLKTEKLLFAVNAWLPRLMPQFSRNVVLVSSDMVITKPMPERLKALNLNHGAAVIDSRIFVNYYRTTSDGRLMLGKGGNYFSFANQMSNKFNAPSQYQTELQQSLNYFFGDHGFEIERTWTGPSDRSVSGFPFFQETDKNVVVAAGYSGNGVVQSYLGGQILASMLLNTHDEWQKCGLVNQNLERFPIEPFRTFGAYVIRNGIRRKERAEDNNLAPAKLDNYLAKLSGAAAKVDTN